MLNWLKSAEFVPFPRFSWSSGVQVASADSLSVKMSDVSVIIMLRFGVRIDSAGAFACLDAVFAQDLL